MVDRQAVVVLEDLGERARVIAVLVRDHDQVHLGEINIEGLDVAEEDFRLRPGVEQDGFVDALDEAGETPVSLCFRCESGVVVQDRDRDLSIFGVGRCGVDNG